MNHQAIYIVGTDTDVGKTTVVSGLLRAMTDLGVRVQALKAVQTGAELDEDVYRQAAPSGLTKTLRRFQLAASPHLAAEAEGLELDLDQLADDIGAAVSRAEFTLIEGAGGIRTPLTRRETFLELMIQRPYPSLLVVGNRLGAVNQALLSAEALRRAGLPAAGLVLNQTTPATGEALKILDDNARTIPALSGWPLLAARPYAAGDWTETARRLRPAAEALLRAAEGSPRWA